MTITDLATAMKLVETLQEDCENLSHFITVSSAKNGSLINCIVDINDSVLKFVEALDVIFSNLSEDEQNELNEELDAIEELYDYDEEE